MRSTWMTTVGARGSEPEWSLLDFPVRLAEPRVEVDGVEVDVPRRVLVRTDRGRDGFLRTVGEDYSLVHHGEFFGPLHERVTARHRVRDVETLVGADGAVARVTWTLYVTQDTPAGYALRQLVAFNGYDGRTAMRAVPGGLLGADGTELRVPGPEYGQRHRGGTDDWDPEEYVDGVLAADLSASWAGWEEVPYGRARFADFLDTTHLGMKARVEVLHRFMVVGPGTLWGAYRAVAWYATYGTRSRDEHTTLRRTERAHSEALRLVRGV